MLLLLVVVVANVIIFVVVVVFRHSWAEQLVPLLSSAQERLRERVSAHKNANPPVHSKLEPAAHLDPGPRGYDIYGGVGFSLSMVPEAYLDQKAVVLVRELAASGSFTCQRALVECRRLLQRFAASTSLGEPPVNVHGHGLAVSTLGKARLPLVAAAYGKAVQLLQGEGEGDLAVQAMNELGDIMMISGNVRWGCGYDVCLKVMACQFS